MAVLTTVDLARDGLDLTAAGAAAAGGGDLLPNNGKELLHVINGGGGSITVTVVPPTTPIDVPGYGVVDIPTISVAVPAGEARLIGPINPKLYNNSSGQAPITYTGVTTVTVKALRYNPAAM